MKNKHGTNHYRINNLKSHARRFNGFAERIQIMWQMSDEGLIDEEIADDYIKRMIKNAEDNWEHFKHYLKYREDMK